MLLLNVPPDTTGRINSADSLRLMEFRAALDKIFKENLADGAKVKASATRGSRFNAANILNNEYDAFWAAPDEARSATLEIALPQEKTFNLVMLQEYIPLGQRIKAFTVEAQDASGQWRVIASETTIGYKRIVPVEKTTAKALRVNIKDSFACSVINGFGLFLDEVN